MAAETAMQGYVKSAAALEKHIYDAWIKFSLLALGKPVSGTDARDLNSHQIASGGQSLIAITSFDKSSFSNH